MEAKLGGQENERRRLKGEKSVKQEEKRGRDICKARIGKKKRETEKEK